jgi:nicotinamide-nucleotide amidase
MDILAAQVGGALKSHGLKLVTAESCTGGGVAQAITDGGRLGWFERGLLPFQPRQARCWA